MTQDSGSTRYEGMLSTVSGATYGAAMALVGALIISALRRLSREGEKKIPYGRRMLAPPFWCLVSLFWLKCDVS